MRRNSEMIKKIELKPDGFETTLKACPPGLFLFNEHVCFKSEYGDDAYCVESGEYFHGNTEGVATLDERVTPLIVEIENE